MKDFINVIASQRVYDKDVYTLKQIGSVYRLINQNAIRVSGLDIPYSKKNSVNSHKLDCNLSRAKSKVKELAFCNDWDFFVTLTISPDKYDRYNLNAYVKDLGRFICNYNRYCSKDEKVKYLLIPEMHADGAWHLHGLIKGIKHSDLIMNDNGYMTWKQYHNKFGYMSIDKIRDKEACSNYILKYISKEMSKTVSELGSHLYYASKGLKTATILYRGHDLRLEDDWDFENDYCRIKDMNEEELHEKVVFI